MTSPLLITSLPGADAEQTARAVAELLDQPYASTDDMVAATAGQDFQLAFVDLGEDTIRAMEREALTAAIAAGGVICVGSGAVHSDEGRALIAGQRSVFLDVGLTIAAKRLGLGMSATALVNPRATLLRQADVRRPLYIELADHVVTTDGKSPREVADEIVALVTDNS